MSLERFETFEDFWPFYVKEHSLYITRAFHFIGTSLGLICFGLAFLAGNLWFLLGGLWISYGFAWFSHFFIEKNRPATFKYPIYSLLADFRMYYLMWRGQMEAEVNKIMNIY
ncbi:MAG: membrane protein [bacterium]|nr:MAG: membrane protein [bacterium]